LKRGPWLPLWTTRSESASRAGFTAAFAWECANRPVLRADERRLFQVGDPVVVGRDARPHAKQQAGLALLGRPGSCDPLTAPWASERIVVRSIVVLSLIVPLAREHCVAKQKGGVYTVESGWRLPSERDVAAVRTRVEAAGHRPEPLSEGFLVRDPSHTAVAFVAHDQDEQSSARTNVRRVT
jgi:hypothetical protein